jgi:hypothetical protein
MRKILIRYRHALKMLSLVLLIGGIAMLMVGCAAPTWLTDASSIITLAGASITSIGSFIAGLTGDTSLEAGLAVVTAWIDKVQTGISDLEKLLDEYSAAPSPTLLTAIESALADVQANLATDFSNLGLPANVLNVIAGIVAVVLQQLTAWGSLIPGLKAAAGETFTVTTPLTKAETKAKVNALLSPTGDATIDAALAKAKRV